MIYLAQPYTHRDRIVRSARFKIAEYLTAHYMKAGEIIFSPIVHCHKLSNLYNLPTDFDFWMAYDFDMISNSESIRVLCMPGWKVSKGVDAELSFAFEHNIPPVHIEWEEIRNLCLEYRDGAGDQALAYWLEVAEKV